MCSGRLGEAEGYFRIAVDVGKRVLGLDHPQTMAMLYNLAHCLSDQGECICMPFSESDRAARLGHSQASGVLGFTSIWCFRIFSASHLLKCLVIRGQPA